MAQIKSQAHQLHRASRTTANCSEPGQLLRRAPNSTLVMLYTLILPRFQFIPRPNTRINPMPKLAFKYLGQNGTTQNKKKLPPNSPAAPMIPLCHPALQKSLIAHINIHVCLRRLTPEQLRHPGSALLVHVGNCTEELNPGRRCVHHRSTISTAII